MTTPLVFTSMEQSLWTPDDPALHVPLVPDGKLEPAGALHEKLVAPGNPQLDVVTLEFPFHIK